MNKQAILAIILGSSLLMGCSSMSDNYSGYRYYEGNYRYYDGSSYMQYPGYSGYYYNPDYQGSSDGTYGGGGTRAKPRPYSVTNKDEAEYNDLTSHIQNRQSQIQQQKMGQSYGDTNRSSLNPDSQNYQNNSASGNQDNSNATGYQGTQPQSGAQDKDYY